jgi:predicted transcriptional regulator
MNATPKSITVLSVDLIASVEPKTWSPRNADSGLAAAKTPERAAAYAAGAIATYREAGDLRQMAAAYATAAMLRQGMEQKDIAKALDLAPASITQYKRMAKAVDLGITPVSDPETWTGLGSKAGAQNADVAKVIMAKDATPEQVKDAVATFVKAKAAKVEESKDSKDKDKGTDKGDKRAPGGTASTAVPDGFLKEPRNNPGRLDLIETMLGALTPLSPKGVERLEEIASRVHLILHPEDLEPTGTDS